MTHPGWTLFLVAVALCLFAWPVHSRAHAMPPTSGPKIDFATGRRLLRESHSVAKQLSASKWAPEHDSDAVEAPEIVARQTHAENSEKYRTPLPSRWLDPDKIPNARASLNTPLSLHS